MAKISMQFPDPPAFAYDPLRPTYFTEYLSWATHKYQAALSAAGASVEIEEVSRENQLSAVASYGASLESWSSSAISALSDFLTGDDDASAPVIPEFPALPDALASAVSLLPGGQIGLLIKAAVPFVKGYFSLRERLRPTDPVRILDKAFLRERWFLPGARTSWLQVIYDKIVSIHEELLPFLSTSVELVPGAGKVPVVDVLLRLVESLRTLDCSNNELSLADLLNVALGVCVPSGIEGFPPSYRGVFDAIEDLRSALGSVTLDVETEKAVRISLGSLITPSGDSPFPSNM